MVTDLITLAMNLAFSFDSIVSAMARAKDSATGECQLWIMILAMRAGGVVRIALAGRVSEFLRKNRIYEISGMLVLFLLGVMLLSEAGHLGPVPLGGKEILPMTQATFSLVLLVLVLTDVGRGRAQWRLVARKAARAPSG